MEPETKHGHIPETQGIEEYLRSMKFRRKLLGGCDRESVLDHFSAVTLQYEDVVSSCLARSEQQSGQIAALSAALARARQENAAQAAAQERLAAWYEELVARLNTQNAGLQKNLMALWAELEQQE